jgi:hypothetical protein
MRTPLIAIALIACTSSARADDYYVAVFAAESVPFKPENTHSFVAAVRVPTGGGPTEVVSISWMSHTLLVRFTLRSEVGVNYGLRDTAELVIRNGWRLSMWGPYRTDADLFCRLKGQAARLDSGALRYKSTDSFFRAGRVQNCYHVLWEPVSPAAAHGFAGAFTPGDRTGGKAVELYAPWLKEPCRTHDAIIDLLGLSDLPITRRGFDDRPTKRDAVRSFLSR